MRDVEIHKIKRVVAKGGEGHLLTLDEMLPSSALSTPRPVQQGNATGPGPQGSSVARLK